MTSAATSLSAEESDAQVATRFERDAMQYHGMLLRAARRLTQSEADAEDLLQDTMMRAFNGFRRFEAGTNLRAWLFRIMHNRWVNNYRMKKRRPDELSVELITGGGPTSFHATSSERSAEDMALDALPNESIRNALATLAESSQLAIFYVHALGFTYAETAALMGDPIGTVMSRVARGRQKLRALLTPAESNEAA